MIFNSIQLITIFLTLFVRHLYGTAISRCTRQSPYECHPATKIMKFMYNKTSNLCHATLVCYNAGFTLYSDCSKFCRDRKCVIQVLNNSEEDDPDATTPNPTDKRSRGKHKRKKIKNSSSDVRSKHRSERSAKETVSEKKTTTTATTTTTIKPVTTTTNMYQTTVICAEDEFDTETVTTATLIDSHNNSNIKSSTDSQPKTIRTQRVVTRAETTDHLFAIIDSLLLEPQKKPGDSDYFKDIKRQAAIEKKKKAKKEKKEKSEANKISSS